MRINNKATQTLFCQVFQYYSIWYRYCWKQSESPKSHTEYAMNMRSVLFRFALTNHRIDSGVVLVACDAIASLYLLKNDKYRTALSKFRTSSHNLEVERGHQTNPVTPLERRLCLMCQKIEDEIHFTTRCQMYKTERLHLYTKVRNKFLIFCTLNDSEKFIFLMQSNDAHVITWMAKFVYRSMSKRSDVLLSKVQEKDETLG